MPFINVKSSVRMTHEQETAVKTRLGQAVSLIPGKSESWLMCGFQDEYRLYFKGDNKQPAAFVEVRVFGGANGAAYEKLTAEITKIIQEELKIPAERVYIQYQQAEHWGWNGSNL